MYKILRQVERYGWIKTNFKESNYHNGIKDVYFYGDLRVPRHELKLINNINETKEILKNYRN